MDIFQYNKKAWDKQVEAGNEWSLPVSADVVAKARKGDWSVVLTPMKPVPRDWFPPLAGKSLLALASGGGQQAPIFAAAGARVTLLDASPKQLAQDRMVAEREGLAIDIHEGDMADLSRFPDATFDFIFHPCSNCFVPDVRKVWREAYRVLKNHGVMISGFSDPIVFCVDPDLDEKGIAQLKYRLPYSDLVSLTDEERRRYTDKGEPLVYGHSLTDQIGGQLAAGFVLNDFYEDGWSEDKGAIYKYIPGFFATRCVKP